MGNYWLNSHEPQVEWSTRLKTVQQSQDDQLTPVYVLESEIVLTIDGREYAGVDLSEGLRLIQETYGQAS